MSDICSAQIFESPALLIAECRNDAYQKLQDYIINDMKKHVFKEQSFYWKGDGINHDLLFEPEF